MKNCLLYIITWTTLTTQSSDTGSETAMRKSEKMVNIKAQIPGPSSHTNKLIHILWNIKSKRFLPIGSFVDIDDLHGLLSISSSISLVNSAIIQTRSNRLWWVKIGFWGEDEKFEYFVLPDWLLLLSRLPFLGWSIIFFVMKQMFCFGART